MISRSAVIVLAATASLAPRASGSVQARHPYAGVTYLDRRETTPRALHMHVLQIDLTAPGLRIELTPPSGDRDVTRQTTRAFVDAEHAQAAINAHFFLPFPSTDATAWVVGLAASNGRVFSAFETPEQRYAIVADAPGLNVDAANRASMVHRAPGAADGLHVREAVTLWTTVSGSAEIVTDGAVTVPVYRDAAHPDGALEPGGPRAYSNANSWYDVHTARTAIGLSRDRRTLTLFTVDARGGSDGMAVGEVAAMLVREYGVWDALNLDGGGSTSMALADPAGGAAALVNSSSDSAGGRAVGTSLAVFAGRTGSARGGVPWRFWRSPPEGRTDQTPEPAMLAASTLSVR